MHLINLISTLYSLLRQLKQGKSSHLIQLLQDNHLLRRCQSRLVDKVSWPFK